MIPTIAPDETIRVDTAAYRDSLPQRWEIVAFRAPSYAFPASNDPGVWVFRIIGLPGDIISFDEGGLLIN